jgi:hypothetical protein
LSAVVGVPKFIAAPLHTVTSAGAVIVGSTLSVTVTTWVAVAVLPLPSVTVQVTVVFPNGNAAGALFVVDATVQLSAVVGVPNTTPVAVQPLFVVADTAAGAVIVGLTLSVTVTTCVAVAVFPLPSVTVQVTVVLPNGNAVGALLVVDATVQLSAVVGVPNTTPVAVQLLFVVADTAAGAVMVGLTLSVTVTNCVAVAVCPLPSVTVHVTVVVPKANAEGALLVTLATEQLSAVTGVPKTTPVAVQPVLVVAIIAAGAVIVGLILSKVKFNVATLSQPAAFVVV